MYLIYIYVSIKFLLDNRDLFSYSARFLRFFVSSLLSIVPVLYRESLAIHEDWMNVNIVKDTIEIDSVTIDRPESVPGSTDESVPVSTDESVPGSTDESEAVYDNACSK